MPLVIIMLNSVMPPTLAMRFNGRKTTLISVRFLREDVHAVVDDVSSRVHEPRQHRGIDLRLAGALLVFDEDVVHRLELLLR